MISNSCGPSEFTLRRNNMAGFRCFLAAVLGLLPSSFLFAQSSGERMQSDPSGEWVLTTVVFGENMSERLKLTLEKDQISGTLFRDEGAPLKGTLTCTELQFGCIHTSCHPNYHTRPSNP